MHPHLITRRLEIDAGHRLLRHEGKCRNYHGHRYAFLISCQATRLDEVGRVLDFGVVKQKVGGWLDAHWDHGMILQRGDPMVEVLLEMADPEDAKAARAAGKSLDYLGTVLSRDEPRFYVVDFSPTSENLAKFMFHKAKKILEEDHPEIEVVGVRCIETPNCWSDYGTVQG